MTIGSTVFGGESAESGNISTARGGAIFIEAGTANIYDSIFSYNQAGSASAIFNSGATINIYGSTFKNNTSNHNGVIYSAAGTINIKNSEFIENATNSSHGGP